MKTPTAEQVLAENAELRARLEEAEQTLDAIRGGEVDAVVVAGPKGEQIFSLVGAESIYRLIIETMKEAAFTLTFDGTILFCNWQFGQFVQRPMEQIVGRRLREFVAPDHVAAADSLLLLGGKQSVKQRLVLWNSQQQPVPVHISAHTLHQPGGPSICIVATDLTDLENSSELIQQLRRQQEAQRDSRIAALNLMKDAVETRQQVEQANENLRQEITARQRAEESLRQLNAELEQRVTEQTAEIRRKSAYHRSLIEASLDPLVTIGPDGKITDVNVATERATGLARGELIGTDFSDYFTEPDQARAGYERVFREGLVRDYPLEVRHRDGHTTPVLYHAAVYRDEAGTVTGVFAAARDIAERKKAEETLKAERQRLYEVLETLPVYVVLLTKDYHVPFANRFFRERFGASQGRCCFDYLFQRTEPCENCETYKVLQTGAPQHWYWTGPDGRDYDIYDFPFTDADGSTMIMEMGIDITEVKKAQTALQELNATLEQRVAERTAELAASEERLRSLYASMTEGVVVHEMVHDKAGTPVDYRLLEVNQAFETITGIPRDRAVGALASELYGTGMPPYLERYSKVAQTGVSDEFETTFDPMVKSFHISVFSPGQGQFATVFMDITERKRAEEAVAAAHRQVQSIIDNTTSIVYALDLDERFLLANAALAELLNSTPEQMIGKRRHEFMPKEDADWHEANDRQVIEAGKALEFEEYSQLQGRSITWLTTKFPLRDVQGRIYAVAGISADVSERKRMEEALRQWNATLESKVAERTAELQHRARQLQKMTLEVSLAEDRERKRMAEILHDDLQQIIAGAKFHVSLLRNRVKHDASLQDIAVQIDGMLKEAVEKSRSLSHELSPAILHHGDFAETLDWLARQMQTKHGLVVHVRADGQAHLQSEAIKSFLYKAAQELLFNVVKHARITEARIRFRQRGPYACLSISDRGRGFDPQGLREAAGFGLLSIRERIELLGGRMKIRSAAGRGSAFFIVVPDGEPRDEAAGNGTRPQGRGAREEPASRDPLAAPLSSAPAPRPSGLVPLRVLLADDHKIVREGLRSLLREEYDIEVVGEALHGREAVDLALRLEPDVVIMDVSMPLIDGDAATRQIKAHLPQTRIIALSTYNEPETIGKMCQAGAEGYVLKTASAEELLAAIRGKARR